MSVSVDIQNMHEIVYFDIWEFAQFANDLTNLQKTCYLLVWYGIGEVLIQHSVKCFLSLLKRNILCLTIVIRVRRILLKVFNQPFSVSSNRCCNFLSFKCRLPLSHRGCFNNQSRVLLSFHTSEDIAPLIDVKGSILLGVYRVKEIFHNWVVWSLLFA